ncbi:MAG: hypothetical protein V4525_05840 [Pseudomonadota bacterium]
MIFLPRTCKEEGKDKKSQPLSVFRSRSAYVLLGEPGAGKTKCFEEEAKLLSSSAYYVKAREFLNKMLNPDWQGKILFIDGLDEVRAGGIDGRLPLDQICSKLEQLGKPHFRLSCREADWLGSLDRETLQAVTPGRDFTVLHLDVLTLEDIKKILDQELKSEDLAGKFIEQAHHLGFQELLTNPKNLDILMKATQDGNALPRSRSEAFELACKQLATEHSKEHQVAAASDDVISPSKLMEAGGVIAVLLLLADKAGFALFSADANDDYPSLASLDLPCDLSYQTLQCVLKSKLFIEDGDARRMPVHRTVAEYLAARYLADKIEKKQISWKRLLTLITGYDGKPVAGLRGLWGWLASFLTGTWRHNLVNIDPVAVVLYGDVKHFLKDDKKYLLDALYRAAKIYPWLLNAHWSLSPFGALATPDMIEEFSKILLDPAYDEAQNVLVECVLRAILHGNPLPELAQVLEFFVRKSHQRNALRATALYAWLHVTPPVESSVVFLSLLNDLQAGIIEDSDHDLLGILLSELYPTYIQSANIFNYLYLSKFSDYAGSYYSFWINTIPLSRDDMLPDLLDQLVAHEILHDVDDYNIQDVVGRLLRRGIESYGDHISSARLYDWLGIGLDKYGFIRIHDDAKSIADWFSSHPEMYKAVLQECINRAEVEINNNKNLFYYWYQRFYGAKPPKDLGIWLLKQAENIQNDIVAKSVFHEAIRVEFGNVTPSLDSLNKWGAIHARFQPWVDEIINPVFDSTLLEYQKESERLVMEGKKKRELIQSQWVDFFYQHQFSLRAGTPPPKVLHDLALVYKGRLGGYSRGDTPYDRLRGLLKDEQLIKDALYGLIHAPLREDLPSLKDIIQTSIKGRHHWLSVACLTALEEAPETISKLDEGTLEKLVAMEFTVGFGKNPKWFINIKRDKPELVARVLITYALSFLRARKSNISEISNLAYDDRDAAIALLAVPSLLSGFPSRVSKAQHQYLRYLLKAGLRYLNDNQMKMLIQQKLEAKSLDIGQRTLWLLAGFIIAPADFQAQLEHHVGKNQKRAEQIADFFPAFGDKWPFHHRLNVGALAWQIHLLGSRCVPYQLEEEGWVSSAMSMADLVRRFINQLGGIPTDEAATALAHLISHSELSAWHQALLVAKNEQMTIQRENKFSHPDIQDILRTLDNKAPANVADLFALTQDYLDELAARIHNGSNNKYREFWSYDEHNKKLILPRPENDCRDILLDDLQALLPQHVIARKEGYYIEDKRADVVISYENFEVPVEIKKDSYANIWSALREQLINQYTREPKTNGYGIYLVLWFDGKLKYPSPHTGQKPKTSDELVSQLQALLTPEEKHRTAIKVIDCSLPKVLL